MKRILLAILVAILATAPAAAQVIFIPIYIPPATLREPKIPDYSGIHSVAVISTLGRTLEMSTNHFMMAEDKDLDIGSWGIDDEIKARLQQYLSPRFVFKDVAFDPTKLAAEPSAILDHPENISSFIQTLPKDAVDAYIIVRPAKIANNAPGFNGLALQNGGAFGTDANPVIWANFQIVLVDARTSQILTKAYSRVRLRDNEPPSFSGMVAPNALKLTKNAELTPAQMSVLHETVSNLLRVSLVETLRSLALSTTLPSATESRVLVPILADKNPYRPYQTVSVVSVLGDEVALERAGSIFEATSNTMSRPDWRIDETIEARAKADLAKYFTIVSPEMDRAALSKSVMWSDSGKEVASFPGLRPGPDMYIVFVNQKFRTRKFWWGKGMGVLQNHTATLFQVGTWVTGNFAMAAIDARTGKVIYAQSVVASPDQIADTPQADIGDANWARDAAAMTPEKSANIQAALKAILENGVDETLLQSGLFGVIPKAAPDAGVTMKAN